MDSHILSGPDMLPADAHPSHDRHPGLQEDDAGAAPPAPHSDDRNHASFPEQDLAEPAEQAAPAVPISTIAPHPAANLELSMPGENEVEPDTSTTPQAAPAAAPQRSSRNVLLGTGAALVLSMLAAGGGYYAWSTRTAPALPSGSMVSNGTVLPAPVRPSAVMAANQSGQAASDATPPARPAPASPRVEPAPSGRRSPVSLPRGDADEILGLRLPPAQATAQVPPPPAAPDAPSASALPPSPPAEAAAVAPAPVAPAMPAQAAPAPVSATVAAIVVTPPPNAADMAASLRPAPMTPQAQVEVLALVTQMGALVRDMRDENAVLRGQVEMLTETVQGRTTDFEQRLNLAEARSSVAAAIGAGHRPVVTPVLATTTVGGGVTHAIAAVPGAGRTVRDYRVQAASPGLAVLADINAAPGQAPGLQVKAGDVVPGIGRVVSIAQRGTAWVVQTDHGAIQ